MEKPQNNLDLRKEFKAIRDNISLDHRMLLSHAITKNVLALLESDFKGANIFLCFYPFGSEVDLRNLYIKLLEQNKQLYFPVCDKNTYELNFYRIYDIEKDFHKGSFNIMEPDESIPYNELESDNTIVLTPGLIFDEKCNRVGYGAGYYDRFFLKKSLVKIGVAFENQIVNNLNVEAHDVPLDYIVTNDRLIKRGM